MFVEICIVFYFFQRANAHSQPVPKSRPIRKKKIETGPGLCL